MGVDGLKKCRCTTNDTVFRWMARLLLTDRTGQVNATGFEVLQSLAQTYADDDDENKKSQGFTTRIPIE